MVSRISNKQGARMTLLAAAEKVLREAGKPLHSYEIIEQAVTRGWVRVRSKTPDRSLQGVIWSDIKTHGSDSIFEMIGKGKIKRRYSLRRLRRSAR